MEYRDHWPYLHVTDKEGKQYKSKNSDDDWEDHLPDISARLQPLAKGTVAQNL